MRFTKQNTTDSTCRNVSSSWLDSLMGRFFDCAVWERLLLIVMQPSQANQLPTELEARPLVPAFTHPRFLLSIVVPRSCPSLYRRSYVQCGSLGRELPAHTIRLFSRRLVAADATTPLTTTHIAESFPKPDASGTAPLDYTTVKCPMSVRMTH